MSLSPGTRLGPYEIVAPIGAGGMGEVFRARDPRLSREVAVKVLPGSLSTDPERLRRFEQEARAAGALNHPNVTAVFDIGSHEGAPYIVEELLEGETLRSSLAGGRLHLRKAVEFAVQIARGLGAAHEKGIVHRDLKPENVFVTKDGRVKILDFGLARVTLPGGARDATALPTATGGTDPGTVLGTLGYMSPEQLRGQNADARSDLFSFGAILYEMLAGARAFRGDSAADTISAILREEPADLSVTNKGVPPGLERIVRHCLEKSPEQRFQSARDVAFGLEALSTTSVAPGMLPAARSRRLSPAAFTGLGALGGAVLAAAVLLALSRRTASSAAGPPSFRRITNLPGAETFPSLSPDGKLLAFVHRSGAKPGVWVQRVDSRRAAELTSDCDQGSRSPAFSPDGSLIAYSSRCGEGGLFVMGPSGENARRLTSFGTDPAWSPDGREIVFSTEQVFLPYARISTSELHAVDVATGRVRLLSRGDAVQASVSPHGRRVAYWGLPTAGSQRDIWTIPYAGLAPGEKPVAVTNDPAVDWYPLWTPDGRALLFLSNRDGAMNLWRVAVDEATGRPLGPPEPERLPAREVAGIALSRDGRQLAYTALERSFAIDRFVIGPDGRLAGRPEEVYHGSQEIADLAVSPDGRTLAFSSIGAYQEDLFAMGSDGAGLRQLTDDPSRDRQPSFSPDGRRVAFHSDRGGKYEIWNVALDGSGLAPMTSVPGEMVIEPRWAPDGRRLVARSYASGLIFPLEGDGKAGAPERIPAPMPGTYASPLDWDRDARHLYCSVIRSETQTSVGLTIYDTVSRTFAPLAGVATLGRAIRASVAGAHLVYGDDDGIHVADFRAGTEHLVLPRGASAYAAVACRGTTCWGSRQNDEADIWIRSLPDRSAP